MRISNRCVLSATKALLERRDTIIVASVSAIYGLGDPQSYLRMVIHLGPWRSSGSATVVAAFG